MEYSGAPDIITVRARSADLTADMRTRRERSWHNTTLGAVLNTLAGEHGLTPRVAEALARTKLPHLDQANESDMNLLTRLGQRFDAVATVKAGALMFTPIGAGTTATGKPLPTAALTRRDGDQHRYAVADRDAYTGVRAYWVDKGKARRQSVLVGTDEKPKRLRESYADQATARQHAHAELGRIKRGLAKLDYTLAIGRAELFPEQRITVSGFKPEIDRHSCLIAKVTHAINSSSGFNTALDWRPRHKHRCPFAQPFKPRPSYPSTRTQLLQRSAPPAIHRCNRPAGPHPLFYYYLRCDFRRRKLAFIIASRGIRSANQKRYRLFAPRQRPLC
ncbi:bacteriophage P2 gpD protein [Xanthomonas fragariae]|uniref:Bacteriophage P2 gpD protein n=1 Tax=Xanthomonas fragariae TaxID=48664 RepID=A0A1Y6HD93_9XANT|nr:bacteriophage P2 gpD protein [Xanthomonas fragariae]